MWDSPQICLRCPVKQGIFYKARRIPLNAVEVPTFQSPNRNLRRPIIPTPLFSPSPSNPSHSQSRISIISVPKISRSPSMNAPEPVVPDGPPTRGSRDSILSTRSKSSSLIDFWRKGRPRTSAGSQKGQSIPASLSFTFSASGTSLLLWAKNSEHVVRIETTTRRSSLLRLPNALPDDANESVAVKCVASGTERCVAVVSYRQVCGRGLQIDQ